MKTQSAGVPRVVTGEQPRIVPKSDTPTPPSSAPRPPNDRSEFERGPSLVGNPRLSAPDLRPQSRLREAPAPIASGAERPPPPNGTARLDEVLPGAGMVTGQVTVNGHTYDFRSGKPERPPNPGRLHVPPGEYRVTDMGETTNDAMTVDGEGWRFRIEDPNKKAGNDSYGDSRHNPNPDPSITQGTRRYLRIHPDGADLGTDGCLGIVGDAATQRQFRADLLAELRRNPNFRLVVQGPS